MGLIADRIVGRQSIAQTSVRPSDAGGCAEPTIRHGMLGRDEKSRPAIWNFAVDLFHPSKHGSSEWQGAEGQATKFGSKSPIPSSRGYETAVRAIDAANSFSAPTPTGQRSRSWSIGPPVESSGSQANDRSRRPKHRGRCIGDSAFSAVMSRSAIERSERERSVTDKFILSENVVAEWPSRAT